MIRACPIGLPLAQKMSDVTPSSEVTSERDPAPLNNMNDSVISKTEVNQSAFSKAVK